MALPKGKKYTMDDIYNLPDGERAELIDGEIYDMAPPSSQHQRISTKLITRISNYIDQNHGMCEVFHAPFVVFLNEEYDTYVEPDISVVCDKEKINDKGCIGAPDWIIEITSPSNQSHDYIKKLNLYQAAGVREYWIVNPIEQIIFVYFFETACFKVTPYTFKDQVKVNIYDNFIIDFSSLSI